MRERNTQHTYVHIPHMYVVYVHTYVDCIREGGGLSLLAENDANQEVECYTGHLRPHTTRSCTLIGTIENELIATCKNY